MMQNVTSCAPSVRVIVVANEKGGSGKSTIAIHLAIALLKNGQSVATVDLDSRQRSFTNYIDNRIAWSRKQGRQLPIPAHVCFDEDGEFSAVEDEEQARVALANTLASLTDDHSYIIVDTPGHKHLTTRLIHSAADVLITPLNDSFVDLDVLGSVDPETFSITGLSHYAQIVEESRRERRLAGKPDTEWFVLRNRLSTLSSRNKRYVGGALHELAQKLGFRCVEGLAERVVFREFYPRGLTAVDDLNEITLGTRPTMSHVAAQMEVQTLVVALLGAATQPSASVSDQAHAA